MGGGNNEEDAEAWQQVSLVASCSSQILSGTTSVPSVLPTSGIAKVSSADLPQATTDKDTAGQESPELQSNPDLGAEQLPKGLGSKTVNYNLSNRRPLVSLLQAFMPLLAQSSRCPC